MRRIENSLGDDRVVFALVLLARIDYFAEIGTVSQHIPDRRCAGQIFIFPQNIGNRIFAGNIHIKDISHNLCFFFIDIKFVVLFRSAFIAERWFAHRPFATAGNGNHFVAGVLCRLLPFKLIEYLHHAQHGTTGRT
ncbi:MAG: hypothetical protein IKA22_00225 [Lentisphaeria bacterium]|nr:hypothetical protein [Lentisphaeria bacterium]